MKEKANFDLHQTQEAVICANLSYYDPYTPGYKESLKELEEHLGSKVRGITAFYKTDPPANPMPVAGYYIATQDKLIEVYHGTKDMSEVMNDLRYSCGEMTLNNGEKLTGAVGFVDEFSRSNKNRLQAKESMQSMYPECKEVIHVGHSLGGVMATYAAIYDKADPKQNLSEEQMKIVTFGTPGSLSKEHDLSHRVLNVQLQYDPIAGLQSSEDSKLFGRVLVIPAEYNWGLKQHTLKNGYNKLFESATSTHVKAELDKLTQAKEAVVEVIMRNTPSLSDSTSYANTVTQEMSDSVFSSLYAKTAEATRSVSSYLRGDNSSPVVEAPKATPAPPRKPLTGPFRV